jgi:hypothetical protein
MAAQNDGCVLPGLSSASACRFYCDVMYDDLAEMLKTEANVTGF